MRTIYISGPMTGYHLYNFPAFQETRDLINARGDLAISPADMDINLGLCNRSRQYATRDVEVILKECDGMYMLTGWEQSLGAAGEFFLGRWIAKDEPEFVFETKAGIVPVSSLLHDFALAHCNVKV